MPDRAAERHKRSKRRRWPFILTGIGVLLALLVIDMWTPMGAAPDEARQSRYTDSPRFNAGRFFNELPTLNEDITFSSMVEFFFGGVEERKPKEAIPVVQRTASDFASRVDDVRITWLGHSMLLIELEGTRILIDPLLSNRASPSSVVGPKRFYELPLSPEDWPEVDAVVISHDHYDHLDMEAVQYLAIRAPRFIVPLGIGSHLEYWGVPADRILELDWWDETDVAGVTLTSTPARHFSGRAFSDGDATLWSGWALTGASHRVYYSGDTSMTPEFLEIGERLGPFDFTLIESGAYNPAWADVHLGPEQAVEAHRMVQGDIMIPVHWGMFDLSLHGWTEPIERIRIAAEAHGVQVAYPKPGESISPGSIPQAQWWPDIAWKTEQEWPVRSSGVEPFVENASEPQTESPRETTTESTTVSTSESTTKSNVE